MRASLVLFDEDCGVCTRFAARLGARGVAAAPIGSPLGSHWLRDLTVAERYGAFHAVDTAGRRYSGAAAVPLALAAGGHLLAARLSRAAPFLTAASYRLVARHRAGLSRLAGDAACDASRPVRRASRARAG